MRAQRFVNVSSRQRAGWTARRNCEFIPEIENYLFSMLLKAEGCPSDIHFPISAGKLQSQLKYGLV
jgi:hypothetical protein